MSRRRDVTVTPAVIVLLAAVPGCGRASREATDAPSGTPAASAESRAAGAGLARGAPEPARSGSAAGERREPQDPEWPAASAGSPLTRAGGGHRDSDRGGGAFAP